MASAAGVDTAGEGSLQAWTDAAERPTWTPIEPEGDAPTGFGARIRRPGSLIGDGALPPRASALRNSLSEKIASVTHHGESSAGKVPVDPGAGAEFGASIPDGLASREPRLQELTARLRAVAADRPEVVLGVAFAGGLVLATILKRLAR